MYVKTVESCSVHFLGVDVETLSGPEAFRVLCLPYSLLTSASWTVMGGDRAVPAGSGRRSNEVFSLLNVL